VLEAVGILIAAFLAGAIPFSNIAARRTRGVDLRDFGTGTVSGTALYRVAGFVPLAVAGVCDVAKGAVGPLLAIDGHPLLAAFAGGLAVCGHDWSPFLRGAGGRGLATALGALIVNAWPGAILLLVAMVLGRWSHQTGLGSFLGEVALAPVLAITNGGTAAIAGAAIAVPMLAKRVMGNGRPPDAGLRAYGRRLLFDHDDVAVS
jgi:glycerol-3-phosphate acyltransferase PlsY